MSIDLESLVAELGALSSDELDERIDRREAPVFDKRWTNARGAIEKLTGGEPFQMVLMAIMRATNQHVVASHVVEDLQLIADAERSGKDDAFVRELAKSYAAGRFPYAID